MYPVPADSALTPHPRLEAAHVNDTGQEPGVLYEAPAGSSDPYDLHTSDKQHKPCTKFILQNSESLFGRQRRTS